MKRVHNFSAGPAILPLEVLEKAHSEFLDYHGIGSSIMEISHRSKEYTEVNEQATERLRRLLGVGSEWHVLFLTGGASTQFMMVPHNFLNDKRTADYINTGTWSKKAIAEAKPFGNVNIAFSSADQNFNRVPKNSDLKLSKDATYLHFTSNNTIFGTQFRSEPDSGNVPLVCDASSDFLSRPLDMKKYGLIYAGAQKNLGPAGVTIVMIHDEFLKKAREENIPTILDYKTHVADLFNTPPVYPVYMVNLVLDWIEKKGGLTWFEKHNTEKAAILYSEIDKDDYYRGTVDTDSRSQMNVTFRLPNEDLEAKFLNEAKKHELVGLKGHRSVGGIRASIYNACPKESVEALTSFMRDFRSTNS
jgi:phosphoserine aminotransferase